MQGRRGNKEKGSGEETEEPPECIQGPGGGGRGFGGVLRLYKVGSEGPAEVLRSTECDQYSSGFPHYWNRPPRFQPYGGLGQSNAALFCGEKTVLCVYVVFKLESYLLKPNLKDMLVTDTPASLVSGSLSTLTIGV